MENQSQEIELLKKSIINLQVCINDLHDRITRIEKPENKSSEHYFYSKDEQGAWLVKCAKNTRNFLNKTMAQRNIPKSEMSMLRFNSTEEKKLIKLPFGLNIISNKEIKQIKNEAFVAGQVANSIGNAIISAFEQVFSKNPETKKRGNKR